MILWIPKLLVNTVESQVDGSPGVGSLDVVFVVVIGSEPSGSTMLTLSVCDGFQEGHND